MLQVDTMTQQHVQKDWRGRCEILEKIENVKVSKSAFNYIIAWILILE